MSTCIHLLDWKLPLACVAVIILSTLYTHHNYNHLLLESPYMLQDLASMQIMGVLLASAAMSAVRAASATKRPPHLTYTHPMIPPAAARRRQLMPLV